MEFRDAALSIASALEAVDASTAYVTLPGADTRPDRA